MQDQVAAPPHCRLYWNRHAERTTFDHRLGPGPSRMSGCSTAGARHPPESAWPVGRNCSHSNADLQTRASYQEKHLGDGLVSVKFQSVPGLTSTFWRSITKRGCQHGTGWEHGRDTKFSAVTGPKLEPTSLHTKFSVVNGPNLRFQSLNEGPPQEFKARSVAGHI